MLKSVLRISFFGFALILGHASISASQLRQNAAKQALQSAHSQGHIDVDQLLSLAQQLNSNVREGISLEDVVTMSRQRATEEMAKELSIVAGKNVHLPLGCYRNIDCQIQTGMFAVSRLYDDPRDFLACLAEARPYFEGFRNGIELVGNDIGYQWPMMPSHMLAAQLLSTRFKDQAPRLATLEGSVLQQRTGRACWPALKFLISAQGELWDQQHADMLGQLINDDGWPTISSVGDEASRAASTLALHATGHPALQKRILAAMEPLLAKREVRSQSYALLYDRVALLLSKRQRYGTQVRCVAGRMVLEAVEDADRIDKLREEVGLSPLETYLSTSKGACSSS